METLSLSAHDHSDVEDEESTPVSPPTPDNAMNISVGPASDSANFINVNPEVCIFKVYLQSHPNTMCAYRWLSLMALPCLLAG